MAILFAIIIAYLLTWTMIPFILLANKRPASTIAWIWTIILFPFIGPLGYWAFGSERIHRKRFRRKAVRPSAVQSKRAFSDQQESCEEQLQQTLPERDVELLQMLATFNGVPTSTANDIELHYGAPDFFEQLHRAIEQASHHVHVQFYIWRDDDHGQALLEALIRAAKRGVEVRLLIDEMGSIGLRTKTFAPLIAAGGKFSWALTVDPLRNRFFWHLRNHRKLQIIDGNIAFVGGMNVGKEYFGEDAALGPWQDAQLQLVGPVVAHLQEVFADDWHYATEESLLDNSYYTALATASPEARSPQYPVQIIADGPDRQDDPLQKSFVALLQHARERVWITTGYFVPNHLLLTAMEMCAARGVDVRLLLAGHSDFPFMVYAGRSYYEELLVSGVRLWEYHAGFMHAKTMLIDDWMMVGSANWDIRSMRLNFELGTLVKSPAQAERLEGILRAEFALAREIRMEEFAKRPFTQRLREAIVKPISPLL